MPEYAYAGTVPRSYPETRDAEGVIVGTVTYGETREFDREWVPTEPAGGEEPEAAPPGWPAPDRDWFPTDEPLPQRMTAEPKGTEPDAAGTSGSTPPGTPPAGQPATETTPPSTPPGPGPAAASPATTTAPAGDGQKAG